jgi:hypothetical protein
VIIHYFHIFYSTLTYQTFIALENDWLIILKMLEDCVLEAIIDILARKATQGAVDALYYQIQSLEKDLATNKQALKWFELFPSPSSAPLKNAIRRPSLAGLFLAFHLSVLDYLMTFHITDKLFSPPQSCSNSPAAPLTSLATLHLANFVASPLVYHTDLLQSTQHSVDEVKCRDNHIFTEDEDEGPTNDRLSSKASAQEKKEGEVSEEEEEEGKTSVEKEEEWEMLAEEDEGKGSVEEEEESVVSVEEEEEGEASVQKEPEGKVSEDEDRDVSMQQDEDVLEEENKQENEDMAEQEKDGDS